MYLSTKASEARLHVPKCRGAFLFITIIYFIYDMRLRT